ncbi:MAG: endolytic transglycosylase MltG [Oscillospiraceae bacterium]|nr:endolytic transglycosylase MltG [Oscillospiraceae bacterium]
MDNEKNNPASNQDDNWLDSILGPRNVPKELAVDEAAVRAAGLVRPDDAELERIVQETMAENWGEPEPEREMPKKQPAPPAQNVDPQSLWQRIRGNKKSGDGLWGIPHLISTAIWLILILAIGISLGRLLWVSAADLLALGKTPMEVTITVEEGDTIDDIGEKLEKTGLIRYGKLFSLFAELTGKGENIKTGSVTFSGKLVYDYNALVNAMSYKGSAIVTVEVMIPEGYSCAQIFKLLEEKGVCKASELEAYAANGELEDYWFLRDVERGHKYCLEGFMFPDTYEFYLNDKPGRVIEKFLDDFDYRFTDRMLAKYTALNQKLGLNLSIREVVIMASIVEKEKANNLEGYSIASVFYNRLTHSASYPYLNSDATLLYDVNYYTGRDLTPAERTASPFNTYTHTGLPKAPIANPGLGSLDAALAPEDTGYYFFIFDKGANKHRFSTNLSDHEKLAKELGY